MNDIALDTESKEHKTSHVSIMTVNGLQNIKSHSCSLCYQTCWYLRFVSPLTLIITAKLLYLLLCSAEVRKSFLEWQKHFF